MTTKLLLVDDEVDILSVLALRLQKSGYDVYKATNGNEAIDVARRIIPDVIILDVYLPDINGDEVAKILKRDQKLKHIPILLVSASTLTLDKRAQDCQAAGFFTKPFPLKDLIEKIESLSKQSKS